MTEHRVCGPDELPAGEVRIVRLGRDSEGYVREAVLLRDHGGTVRAYRNLCKHLPIPLDAGSRRFFGPSGQHIECATHGATYRLEDGVCIAGPCVGERLDALGVEERPDGIYLL